MAPSTASYQMGTSRERLNRCRIRCADIDAARAVLRMTSALHLALMWHCQYSFFLDRARCRCYALACKTAHKPLKVVVAATSVALGVTVIGYAYSHCTLVFL
jgi:hypothetical protein